LRGVDDDLYALLLGRDYPGHDAVKAALPIWPGVEYVQDCTGNLTLFDAVKESVLFWKFAKEMLREHGRRKLKDATVVDYGAGWGRITRFCAKDVARLYAVEPNGAFREIFEQTKVPGELIASDHMSSTRLPVRGADLLFCFSILTHASEQLARNIRDRWVEMMARGGVVVFTIRPGSYLDQTGGEIARLPPEDLAAAREAYANGRPGYWPYPDSPDWGITITPMAFLDELFSKHFEIIQPRYFLQNDTQLPIVMVRK
jgi:methyltransferase family protein